MEIRVKISAFEFFYFRNFPRMGNEKAGENRRGYRGEMKKEGILREKILGFVGIGGGAVAVSDGLRGREQ